MMVKKIVYFFLLFVIVGCTTVKVVNINEAPKFYKNAVIYALPETVLQIDVTLNKTTYIRGPFYEYAEKYLNITNVIKKNYSSWDIVDINIDSYAEPDYNNYYVLESNNKSLMNGILLNKYGIIESINKTAPPKKNEENNRLFLEINHPGKEIQFTDLSVKRNINENQDTVYKKVKQDTTFVKVPVIKKQIEKKSINEKAEEAANFIIKLRKRRFKMLVGLSEKEISSHSIEPMIEELNRLEAEYLSLFIGKKYDEKYLRTFSYTPNKSKDIDTGLLFNFSKDLGIVSKEDKTTMPILVKVINDGKTKVIDSYLAKREEEDSKEQRGIVYRIPDFATVQILSGNDVIARKRLMISQFGTLNLLPEQILKSKNISIKFNPTFGNVEEITN
jgi:hypothetical protein